MQVVIDLLGPTETGLPPAKTEQLDRFCGLLPERQGHDLAVTVLYVPYSLDSGGRLRVGRGSSEGGGSARVGDAHGTPTQSHISSSIF
jgi:hypothetical protein